MAIDRIAPTGLAALVGQRPNVSEPATLVAGTVLPLVPIGPFMAPTPEVGAARPSARGAASADTLAAGGAGGEADPTPRDTRAMQTNQLFFARQLVWHMPDAATLAASWRVMVATYGAQRAAMQEQGRGLHVAANLFMAEPNPDALRDNQRAPLLMDTEAWRFAVYGWGGQRLTLRVLASRQDEQGTPKRRRGKLALRLELVLPEGGRAVVQIELFGEGIAVDLASADASALPQLRRMLPELGAAIARAGLHIVRCRIGLDVPALRAHDHASAQLNAANLPLGVFRAMAEVASLLSRPEARAARDPEQA